VEVTPKQLELAHELVRTATGEMATNRDKRLRSAWTNEIVAVLTRPPQSRQSGASPATGAGEGQDLGGIVREIV
jgi:hypothetical protein